MGKNRRDLTEATVSREKRQNQSFLQRVSIEVCGCRGRVKNLALIKYALADSLEGLNGNGESFP
jgi:hypothetical protein